MPRKTALRRFTFPDAVVLMVLGTVVFGFISVAQEWKQGFHPITDLDLSVWSLPKYTFFSFLRGLAAYVISLGFTLVFGYWAARSRRAEQVIVPLMDILQSIPVSAFLPVFFLGLIAVFPDSNFGLEVAAILSIFTSQAWNMSFGYYNSLKSIPDDLIEVSSLMGLTPMQRLLRLELPFASGNLAWNSVLSVAGGWFFLSACESFNLGTMTVLLPGLGSYIAIATNKGDYRAVFLGTAAMMSLIIALDFLVWRPMLAWVRRFRFENALGTETLNVTESLLEIVIRESRLVHLFGLLRRFIAKALFGARREKIIQEAERVVVQPLARIARPIPRVVQSREFLSTAGAFLLGILTGFSVWGAWKFFGLIRQVPGPTWILLLRDTMWTLLRILACLVICTLWAVPAGIWIGLSPKRIRIFQPIIQILASFPAPTLFPLAVAGFLYVGLDFSWSSTLLLVVSVQWYVLFNVLAGALRISEVLDDSLRLVGASTWDRWKRLFLPAIFPSLLGGWVNAAGGAWNAAILSEYVFYGGKVLKAAGIGAVIRTASDEGNFPLLAASVSLMVAIVILLNRSLWAMLYRLAQTRYKLEV